MSRIPAKLEPEWSVLLTACSTLPAEAKLPQLRSKLQSPVRWQSLFALAERHGVQPLLSQALHSIPDAIPAEEMRLLEQNNQTNLHKALLLSRELIRILRHLSDFDFDVMPYKGLALAESLYGDIALRQAGDIDLLVRRDELRRVEDSLAKLGYTPHARLSEMQQRAYLKSGYETVFDGSAGRNVLEVQWAILPRFYTVAFEMEKIFERGVAATVAGQTMKTPSPGDLLLILSVHAAKHVWGRLIWICDLARLITLPSLDWDWIASQARELGITDIVHISLLLANRLLGTAIPVKAQNWLAEKKLEPNLVSDVEQHLCRESGFSVESVSYFRLMMRLRERRSDRLRFLSRLVLTPGPSEWSMVRLPASLFPLYRLVRLSRLTARMLRG